MDWGLILQGASIASALLSAYVLMVIKRTVHKALYRHNRDEFAHPTLMEETTSQAMEIQALHSEVAQVRQIVNHTREVSDIMQKQNDLNHRTTVDLLHEIQRDLKGSPK